MRILRPSSPHLPGLTPHTFPLPRQLWVQAVFSPIKFVPRKAAMRSETARVKPKAGSIHFLQGLPGACEDLAGAVGLP